MIRRTFVIFRTMLLLCAAFALMSVSFAHRGMHPDMSPELAAYLAAGGAISDLCGTVEEHENTKHRDCEACRIVDTFVELRFHNKEVSADTSKLHSFRFTAKKLAQSRALDPARLTRAPPQA